MPYAFVNEKENIDMRNMIIPSIQAKKRITKGINLYNYCLMRFEGSSKPSKPLIKVSSTHNTGYNRISNKFCFP